jgi:hypothetical protein
MVNDMNLENQNVLMLLFFLKYVMFYTLLGFFCYGKDFFVKQFGHTDLGGGRNPRFWYVVI